MPRPGGRRAAHIIAVVSGLLLLMESAWAVQGDPPKPGDNPRLELTKTVAGVRPAGTGFEVDFQILIENTGETVLDNVIVTDNLSRTFPPPVEITSVSPPQITGALQRVRSDFAVGQIDLLPGNESLPAGASAAVTFTVGVARDGLSGTYENYAIGQARSPEGEVVRAKSKAIVEFPSGDAGIGLAKAASACERVGDDGFAVGLAFTVQNFADIPLSNVQITDDLAATFGATPYAVEGLSSAQLQINPAFNGDTVPELLLGNDGLAPGATATVELRVSLAPGGGTGAFLNSAVAFAEGAEDRSVYGFVPDKNGNGDPGDDDAPTPIKCDFSEPPAQLLLVKHVDDVVLVDPAAPRYRVDFRLEIENSGEVDLHDMSLTDVLRDTFPAPIRIDETSDPEVSGGLSEGNPLFGPDDPQLLSGRETLAAGGTASVRFSTHIEPGDDLGPFTNVAVVTGTTATGKKLSDKAEDDLQLPPPPAISLTKHVDGVSVVDASVPSYLVEFRLEIENTGVVALEQITLVDVLTDTFPSPAEILQVSDPQVSGDLSEGNDGFGAGDADLLSNTETLEPGETATVAFTVVLDPGATEGPYLNTATVTGTAPDGTQVSDTDAEEVEVPESSAGIELTKDAVVTGWNAEGYLVGFALQIHNVGEVVLGEITLTDDLRETFPAPFEIRLVDNLNVTGDLAVANGAFGRDNPVVLAGVESLEPDGQAEVSFTVEVAPDETFDFTFPLDNRADVTGIAPDGEVEEDHDTARVRLPPPQIGLSKDILSVVSTPTGQHVEYQLIVTNTGETTLYDVQVSDDLHAAFPSATEITLLSPPDVSGDLSEGNPAYLNNGNDLLSGTEALEVGESAVIEYTVSLAPAELEGPRENTAEAEGFGPGRLRVTDEASDSFPLGGVNGFVYLDRLHDRVLDDDERASGWVIEVFDTDDTSTVDDANPLRSTQTDGEGYFLITGLHPRDYVLQFVHPQGIAWARVVVTVPPNELAYAEHPLDPQGVIYELATVGSAGARPGEPLAGAQLFVTRNGTDGTSTDLPAGCLLRGQQGQVVDDTGEYVMTVTHADPACPETATEYGLRVVPPQGFEAPSPTSTKPPEPEPYDAVNCSTEVPGGPRPPCLVQSHDVPPSDAELSELDWHDRFITARNANTIVNNHIPLERIDDPPTVNVCFGIDVEPSRPTVQQARVLGYTITVSNGVENPSQDLVTVTDRQAPGFEPLLDTAQLVRTGLDGLFDTADDEVEDIEALDDGGEVAFQGFPMDAGEVVQIRYSVRVTVAVSPGTHENVSSVNCRLLGKERAIGKVTVEADPLFSKATLLGKVFADENRNNIQDDDEPGIENARLITPEGLEVTTDAFGRFHIADIDVTRGYGINYVVKLDASSLAREGEEADLVISDVRQIVRLTPGGIGRVKFAVKPRPLLEQKPDCCKPFQEANSLRQSPPGKILDATLRAVTPTRGERGQACYALEFELTSNYFGYADCLELTLTTTDGHERLVENRVFAMDGHRRRLEFEIEADPDHRQLQYQLHAFLSDGPRGARGEELVCKSRFVREVRKEPEVQREPEACQSADKKIRPVPLLDNVDATHARVIDLPDPDSDAALEFPRQHVTSSLSEDRIELPHAMNNVATRYITRGPHAGERETGEVLNFPWPPLTGDLGRWQARGLHTTMEAHRGGDRHEDHWTLPQKVVEPGEQLQASQFADVPANLGSEEGWVHLSRHPAFIDDHMDFAADREGGAAMFCCDIETSLATEADRTNDTYTLRFTNREADRTLEVCQGRDDSPLIKSQMRDLEAGCWDDPATRKVQVPPKGQAEFYLGAFNELGPKGGDDWASAYVFVRPCPELDADGNPVCDDGGSLDPDFKGPLGYQVVRERDEEYGQWRPPRTVSICNEVTGEPKVHEDDLVAGLELVDLGERKRDVVSAREGNFGVAVIDLTVGGWSNSGHDDALAGANGQDGGYVDGRLAGYWRGWRGVDVEDKDPDIKKRAFEWVLQADTTKDELSNLSDNLERKDPKRLFRQLDPDHHYPTYGDDSVTTLATDTQGAFYGAVRYGQSSALWGNYHTDFRGTEFAQFNRSLYGAAAEYKSADQTPYGDPNVHLRIFGSQAQSASAHAEFRATGGSLYYLRHTDIVVGSEKVWVEVRRRDSLQLEERRALAEGRDYEIDPLQGRILLRAPLHQVMRSRFNNVIDSRPLDGDDVYLMVDYEYVPSGFEADDLIYGGRLKVWAPLGGGERAPQLGLGATYVLDEQDTEDQTLMGVDVTLRHGRNSYLSAEFATSDSASALTNQASFDGGLTFDDANRAVPHDEGEALGAEALLDFEDFGLQRPGRARAWWKKREAGFQSGNFALGGEVTDAGVDVEAEISDGWRVNASVGETRRSDGLRAKVARVQSDYEINERWQLDAELRHEDGEGGSDVYEWSSYPQYKVSNLVGLRLAHKRKNATAYARAQVGEDRSDDFEDGDMGAVGVNVKLNDDYAVSAEVSSGDRGDALMLGVDYSAGPKSSFNVASGVGSGATTQFTSRYTLLEGHELYGTYTIDPDRSDGDSNVLTLGQRRDAGNRTRIFTESQFAHDDRRAATGHTVGVEVDATGEWTVSGMVQGSEVEHADKHYERRAWSLGAVYSGEQIKFSTRAELRKDESDAGTARQYVTSNALRWHFDDDRRMLGKLNAALVDDDTRHEDLGRFVEFDLAYAHRPVETTRFDLISRYAYLYDVGTEGQRDAPGDEKSHLFAVEGIYELGGDELDFGNRAEQRELTFGARIAARKGAERAYKGSGPWEELELGMVSVRATYTFAPPHRTRFCGDKDRHKDASDKRNFGWCKNNITDLLFNRWELLGEYRVLKDFITEDVQSGALIGLFKTIDSRHRSQPGQKQVSNTYRVGAGYNFSGFDSDLRRSGYKARGWFVDVMAVF